MTGPPAPPFTYDWYGEFLRHCQTFGRLARLCEVGDSSARIVLRHDVDFDLEVAAELSRLEDRLGVRSTYLVLVSTHFYNVSSARGRSILRDLVAHDFEVGLHFDASLYGSDPSALAAGFAAESRFLESLIGTRVRSASLHTPSSYGSYPLFRDVVNAYDTRWFSPETYLSDSLRQWKHDPFDFVRQRAGRTLQILTHPIHFGQEPLSYVKLIERVCADWCAEARRYVSEHNTTYRTEAEKDRLSRQRSASHRD